MEGGASTAAVGQRNAAQLNIKADYYYLRSLVSGHGQAIKRGDTLHAIMNPANTHSD
jgi:hypothetical protein